MSALLREKFDEVPRTGRFESMGQLEQLLGTFVVVLVLLLAFVLRSL